MINLKTNIPSDFFNEEERSGFVISRQMKEIWAVELDLLAEFQRVCKANSINYIASGGTMLGAARHGGFIPWDDDIDIMMSRTDYSKLLSLSKEFKLPYFLQTYQNDKGFFRCFARLRNSLTTAIQNTEKDCHFRYNQGIFIDIFPMDNLIDDEQLLKKQSKKALHLLKKALFYSSFQSRYYEDKNIMKKVIRHRFSRVLPLRGQDLRYLELFDKECQKYNSAETEKVSLLSFQFNNRGHDILRKDLSRTVDMDFEFLKIPVPSDYDRLLTHKYGDWKTPSKMPSYHGEIFFDTDKSFTHYI
ncbi:MAG: LicD family protein [Bacteroidales bacterium]|nr:LicD family protein [Bacteroidales bacterium]